MKASPFRRGLLHTTALAGALTISLAATGAYAQEHTYNIPAQSLAESLRQYGMASGEQIIFAERIVAARQAPPLQGAYTADDALKILLADSGLVAQRTSTGGIMIASASDPQSGSAAGDGAEGTVQALVVTAQKREENIQDVPIAMSAFTQEDLTRSQVAGGPDLMTQVPNFTFTKTNFSGYSIQIRGIGTQAISATTDPAVAVAFNNTPFVRNRFFEQEFYDLERVEVLRGPQGTLYGRNATAGVVNIISAKPKFSYEARLSADVGNYNSTRLEGMVNMPLVDDKVALRLAGAWTKRDGYDTNSITGHSIDGRDLWSTRLSLRFAPTDKIDANLIWEHFNENDDRLRSGKQLCNTDEVTSVAGFLTTHDQDLPEAGGVSQAFFGVQGTFSQGCRPTSLYAPESFQTPEGLSIPYYAPLGAIGLPIAHSDPYLSRTQSSDLRVIESTVDPNYRAKNDIVEFQLGIDLTDTLKLTSETAWASDFIFSTEDFNRFNTAPGAWSNDNRFFPRQDLLLPGPNGTVFCDPQVGCADRLVAVDLSTAKSRHFSQEFRLASDFEGPFNFSLGANFLRYDTEDKYYVFVNSLTLYSAISPYERSDSDQLPPWVAGVSDNHECQPSGAFPPDPTRGQEVIGCMYIDPNPIGSLNDQGHNYFLSKNPYKLISYAAFGEVYYNITDNLKITAGLRWTVDKKEAPRIPSWLLATNSVGYPVMEVIRQEWREPTGRLTVDWKPDLSFTDETLLYASYAHGYKAGGANPPPYGVALYHSGEAAQHIIAQSVTHPKTFDPEFANAFEIGSKNTLLDGKLTLNADAFYYDYTGYQISQIVDRSAVNLNFDARVWGLEFESDWRPLENLRLGLKLGYENTRVADGMKAVDIMDRTAGHTDWVVVRPFPSIPSNCILPVSLFVGTINGSQELVQVGQPGGGNIGACELAYVFNFDPITGQPYVPNPSSGEGFSQSLNFHPGYAGWDPATAPNHGEGFYKDLSGHELPNAPHYTATFTADYTVPLPSDWLMTLHSDFYYQSEAWTRIFNTPGYDKLKAYNNVNFAAIFTNEDAGWKVMAYVKNVFDKANITGAFLNSDDTGLTTNVFLNEPRLYGIRVTKEWTGGSWWTGANPNHPAGEPYPLTVELGGQVQRQDAPYDALKPGFASLFPAPIDVFDGPQNQKLDWGDGREVKLTYQPVGSPWNVSAGVRYGKTNGAHRVFVSEASDPGCQRLNPAICAYWLSVPPTSPYYGFDHLIGATTRNNFLEASATDREEHEIADFAVGRDVSIGSLRHSTVSGGLRYAQFKSTTKTASDGVPDWHIPNGWKYFPATHDRYIETIAADREFTGAGPAVTWDASLPLLGNNNIGHLDIDWSLGGSLLFGKQKASVKGAGTASYYTSLGLIEVTGWSTPDTTVPTPPIDIHRTKSTSVPVLDLGVGLSYEIQRIKVSTGYRWERYFNVLDAGYAERKSNDRTMDGPYFKIAVGFGG